MLVMLIRLWLRVRESNVGIAILRSTLVTDAGSNFYILSQNKFNCKLKYDKEKKKDGKQTANLTLRDNDFEDYSTHILC